MGNNIERQISVIFGINSDQFYIHRKLRQKKIKHFILNQLQSLFSKCNG